MSSATTDEMGLGSGAAVGAGAWVLGVVLTYVLATLGVSAALSFLVGFGGPVLGTLSAYITIQSWFIYGAGAGAGSIMVWMILPIILLVAAGFYAGSQNEGSGFMAGVGVTVGYFALAVLSAIVVMAMGGTGDIVQLILALIVSGVVFPLIFAGIGGVIADQA